MIQFSYPEILFEDNHILVCIKSPGILSQPNGKDLPDMLSLLKNYIKNKYNKPGDVYLGLVHRLDTNVGGVMVFAKTSKAAARLSEAIRNHDFVKEYYAVLNADLPLNYAENLTDFLVKNEIDKIGYITEDEEQGKEASLDYKVIDKINRNGRILSFVSIRLNSGRFHQIRLQFSSRGWPLHGDRKYGGDLCKNQNELGLYAYRLSFPHPITKEIISYEHYPNTPLFSLFFEKNSNR